MGGRVNDAARGLHALGTYGYVHRTREWRQWQVALRAEPGLKPHRRTRALTLAARAESLVGDEFAAERYATEAIALSDAAGIDPPWGAIETKLVVSGDLRQDAAEYRRWWERGRQGAEASGQRYLQLLVDAARGIMLEAWDLAELVAHYERVRVEIRPTATPCSKR